jgi:sirohydrochlorin cobaltochelatase
MKYLFVVFLCLLFFSGVVMAKEKKEEKSAIVIASFGTTYLTTLKSIEQIENDVKKAFPHTRVELAFTSNIIRKIWHKRDKDKEFKKAHPNVNHKLYNIKNVLGTLADLQNEGYRNIVVQSTHVANGEEYHDLMSYVRNLEEIRTFKRKFKPFLAIALGKPLMGTYSPDEYIDKLAEVLEDDVRFAKKENAALVYMGHGNEHMPIGYYYQLELKMNRKYDIPVFIGLVEGLPDLDSVIEKLKNKKVKKIILKPLMIVAGDHANNDMAGDEDDSWKVILRKEGFEVKPVLEGLGDKAKVRQIFVNHIREAAKKKGIILK